MTLELIGLPEKSPSLGIIRGFYDEEELRLIWRELEFLTSFIKMDSYLSTGSAINDGEYSKNNRAIFLDQAYRNHLVSDILRINRKVFKQEFLKELSDHNKAFNNVMECNKDTTLVSYYEDGAYYKPHRDSSHITVLSYFVKDETKLSGGELYFPEFDVEIKIENNMTIYMPSHYLHEVKTVSCSENGYSTFGRYCMSQFLTYRD